MNIKHLFFLVFLPLSVYSFAQQKSHLQTAVYEFKYIYPFADRQYALELQYRSDEEDRTSIEQNVVLSFIKKTGKKSIVIWRENALMQVKSDVRYEDYNNDGVKDLTLFSTTGSRGSNEHYQLYLINPKNHTLTKVIGFDEITNPSYNSKFKVILGYGYAGANYYSTYRINGHHKIYKIGESFEDNNNLDLDQEIAQLLKKHAKD